MRRHHAYACPSALQPTHITPPTLPDHPSFHAYAWLTSSPTSPFNPTITHHPRICVHAYAYAWDSHPLPLLTNLSILPRTQLLSQHPQPTSFSPIFPHICVLSYAYAWEPNPPTSTPFLCT
ncbi:hypothetical protein PIB30_102618 [Stylosanthes scabra]|uniref:Uncharacterized protein n=1 Tax=Stylosanthes scabra TaxID=79078 RepID=A0ABU6VY78_9FABA|nr:hypothetical protein [Stylosanthes scabra]